MTAPVCAVLETRFVASGTGRNNAHYRIFFIVNVGSRDRFDVRTYTYIHTCVSYIQTTQALIYSFILAFIQPFIHTFTHSFVYLFIYLFILACILPFIDLLSNLFIIIIIIIIIIFLLAITTHLRVLASSILRFRDHTQ